MRKNAALALAGIIFALIALLHLLRWFYNVEIIASGVAIPMWASIVALIVFVILTIVMFKARLNPN